MATSGYSETERGHDETFDLFCSLCQANDKNIEAEKFCTQCCKYFCLSCVKIHETLPGLKYHKILDKAQFMSETSVVVQAVPTETRKRHGPKPVDMFCEQHDKIDCSTCLVIDHSECKKKVYIPDYVKNKQACTPADISEMEVLGSVNVTQGRHDKASSHDVSLQQKLSSAGNQKQDETKQHGPKEAAEVNISKLKTTQLPSLLKIKRKTYTVRQSSDTQIASACVLDDGTVILADDDNDKLKRLDRSRYRVGDSCDVPPKPWQMCVISHQEVAVSCTESELIQFVFVGGTMCKTRQIHTDFGCRGLACADAKLYVSDSGTSVYVYTVSGERLQQLSPDQFGQSLFSDIRSLAVSSDSSRIYVADSIRGLIILEISGKLVNQYNGLQLDQAQDVCLYKNDSVLVCGFDSKNVLQFAVDGQLVGEVLKSDECGWVICCDEKNSKLLVITFTNIVEIYDINTQL